MIVQLSEAEAAAATISSGLRTALTSPWRALAPSTFGPRMRKSGSRTDETLRTRAWRANSASPPGFAGVGVLMFALVAAVWLVARVWHCRQNRQPWLDGSRTNGVEPNTPWLDGSRTAQVTR